MIDTRLGAYVFVLIATAIAALSWQQDRDRYDHRMVALAVLAAAAEVAAALWHRDASGRLVDALAIVGAALAVASRLPGLASVWRPASVAMATGALPWLLPRGVALVAAGGGVLAVAAIAWARARKSDALGPTQRLALAAAAVLGAALVAKGPAHPEIHAPLAAIAAGVLALAAARYAMASGRDLARATVLALVSAAAAWAFVHGVAIAFGVTTLGRPSTFELAPACVAAVVAIALRPPTAGVDTATGELDVPRRTRETLLALDRMTDPLSVQEGVFGAVKTLLPGARLELLRTRLAPPGTLAHAREIPPAVAIETSRRGYVAVHQAGELEGVAAAAVRELGRGFVVPVESRPTIFGVLHVDHPRPSRAAVEQARRFADMLGQKLETHRLQVALEAGRRRAALGELLAGVAHDLRSPLTTIKLNLQDVGERLDSSRDREALAIALGETDRLAELSGAMLELARPIDIAARSVEPAVLVRETVERCRAQAESAKVTIVAEVDKDAPAVRGDPGRLSRALGNILENAVGVSAAGGEVRVALTVVDGAVRVVVRDLGPGIPVEDVERIFEPFFSRRAGGTGLGLAIAHAVVTAHGGRITVRSGEGDGSTFVIELPTRV
jgi:signal transduction histidine kinase